MNKSNTIIKIVPFTELVAVNSSQSTNAILDVIIDNPIVLDTYCNALLDKILVLEQKKFSNFINHQLEQVCDPLGWLDSFDALIKENQKIFIDNCGLFKYKKLENLIQKQRGLLQCPIAEPTKFNIEKKYINAESEERYFSFYQIKKQLDTLEDENEKILLLTKEKHAYSQSNIEFINQKLPLFDVQCLKEIEQIYEVQNIKNSFASLKSSIPTNPVPFTKLQFNCNVNQFVDIFYRLSRELSIDGKPILQGNSNDIVAMIVHSFLDKEGREISPQSVKTILQPTKEDKRPNIDKRINFQ